MSTHSLQPFLIATGENRPLAPLTDELPPAMLPVGHQPVMAHVVEMLAAQGFRRLLVSLHYQPAGIEAYFGQGQRWGVSLEYVIQRSALGSAGALKRAGRLLNETILVISAEKLLDVDVCAALAHHRAHGYAATILIPASGCQATANPSTGNHASAEAPYSIAPDGSFDPLGVYILEPTVLDLIPPSTPFDIQNQLIPMLLHNHLPVGTFAIDGYFNPLATWPDYSAAQRVFMERLDGNLRSPGNWSFPNTASVRGRGVQPGIWVGRNNAIHPTARLAAPVFIGSNCRVGRDVELGPGVVLGANVIVDDEATLSQSVVLDNTYVGKLVKLDQRLARKNLLVDLASGEHVRVADAFWLSETHTSMDQSIIRQAWDRLVALLLGIVVLPLGVAWALALWLTGGRVFRHKTYVRPVKPAGAGQPAASAVLVTVLNFGDSQPNRLAAWLNRWQRRLGLERLPELLSVIAGELRLVGVRPLTPDEAHPASEDWQLAQRESEPGFTGLWYLQPNSANDPDAALVADVYYAATQDWLGDVKILCQTPAAWLRRLQHSDVTERSRS